MIPSISQLTSCKSFDAILNSGFGKEELLIYVFHPKPAASREIVEKLF